MDESKPRSRRRDRKLSLNADSRAPMFRVTTFQTLNRTQRPTYAQVGRRGTSTHADGLLSKYVDQSYSKEVYTRQDLQAKIVEPKIVMSSLSRRGLRVVNSSKFPS